MNEGSSHVTSGGTATAETTPLLQAGGATAVTLAATAEPARWRGGDDAGDDETENPDRPRGFGFAVAYGCILLGDFSVGYVSFFLGVEYLLHTSLCHNPPLWLRHSSLTDTPHPLPRTRAV